jgi:hypothetical protein
MRRRVFRALVLSKSRTSLSHHLGVVSEMQYVIFALAKIMGATAGMHDRIVARKPEY